MISKRVIQILFVFIILIISAFFNQHCSCKNNDNNNQLDSTGLSGHDTLRNSVPDSSKNQNPDTTENTKHMYLFVGTYTDGSGASKSTGIYWYEFDTITGALTYIAVSSATSNPSYITIHPTKKWLFCVNELSGSASNYLGKVSAFSIDLKNKKLSFINSASSEGNAPCYISIDNTGKYLMTANYNSGSVAVLPINKDGSVSTATSSDQHQGSGPNAGRQDGPHAHMIMQAENNFIYNTDLGIDEILIYTLDTTNGALNKSGFVQTNPGAGPRHLAFHPNHTWAYVVTELTGTIEAFTIDNSTGSLTRFQVISTLPSGGNLEAGSADIHITPDGKYLYASNRGAYNNIAMFSINQQSGELTLLGHQSSLGSSPRNFVIDATGTFLLVANQNSNNVITFKINSSTGILIETGIETKIPEPVCLKFME